MTDRSGVEPPLVHPGLFAGLARAAAATVVALSVLALLGWAVGVETPRSGRLGIRAMTPMTASGHLLSGLSLLLLLRRRGSAARHFVAIAMASGVLVLGTAVLVQYGTGWDLGIDRLLFPGSVGAIAAPFAGRASLASAVGFILAGLSLSFLAIRPGLAQVLGTGVLLVAGGNLIGFAYGAEGLYDWGATPATSFPSALAFLAFALGLILARPDRGPASVLSRDDLGGYMARRLLPVALVAPFFLGLLRVLGERAGLFGPLHGLSLVIATGTAALVVIIWASAWKLQELDRSRREVEDALRQSERRLRTTLDTLPVGVWFTDEEGRIIYGNPAGQRIWGGARYVRPEGFHEYRGWWPDTGRRIEPEEWAVARAIRKRETSIGEEIEIETFDGKRKMLRNSAAPLIGSEGDLLGAVIVNEDITERKRSETEQARARAEAERRAREEAALQRATSAVAQAFTVAEVVEKIARNALEATAAGAALVERIDAEGEVEVVAAAGRQGVRVGPRVPYHGSLAERAIHSGKRVLVADVTEDPRTPDYIVRILGRSRALVVPLMEGGEAMGALILLRSSEDPAFTPDEMRRATTFADLASLAFRKAHLLEDSERKRRELQRVLDSQSWLVRGFSHDVKNPLGAADGHLALFEEGLVDALTERQRVSIGRARRSIHSALRLIDALVEFARAEAGQIKLRRVETDLPRLAEELLEEHRPAAEARGLALELAYTAGIRRLHSDPDRIHQILGNLLSNAIKYTDEGEVTVRVEERTDRGAPGAGPWIAMDVADTGPGIPSEKREEVFREFTRLNPDAGPGAGLGLAVSRRIARLLGGEVTLESASGEGSTFTLWLPVRPTASPTPSPSSLGSLTPR